MSDFETFYNDFDTEENFDNDIINEDLDDNSEYDDPDRDMFEEFDSEKLLRFENETVWTETTDEIEDETEDAENFELYEYDDSSLNDRVEDYIDLENDPQKLEDLRDELINLQYFEQEASDIDETEHILKRELTDLDLINRERDTDIVLENYRENLRDNGVEDETAIEKFIEEEREKINAEYASLDAGEPSHNIYEMPTDWQAVAENIKSRR